MKNKCKEEICYVMVKPGFEKCLPGIIEIIHKTGAKCINIEKINVTREQMEEHYAHVPAQFREETVSYMLSEPVIAMQFAGDIGVVEKIRKVVGDKTTPAAGTIRYCFGINSITKNVVHASDSAENGIIESKRFFHEKAKTNVCKISACILDILAKRKAEKIIRNENENQA